MNAGEKVAWTHVIVSIVATALAFALIPFVGPFVACSAFAIMALISVFGAVFLRRRGDRVIIDERDREISRRATQFGVGAAWMVLLGALIVVTVWWGVTETKAVPVELLAFLLWFDNAVVYAVKGLAGVVLYRRQRHAT